MVAIILVIANNHQSDCEEDIESMSTCSSDCLSDSPQFETYSLCTHAGHVEIFHLQPHQQKWDECISVYQNCGHLHVSQSKIHYEVNDSCL